MKDDDDDKPQKPYKAIEDLTLGKIESTENAEPYKRIVQGFHKDELIEADGTYFCNAVLEDCVITYSGGESSWTNLKTINCTFRFLGSAIKTIRFLNGFKSAKEASGIVDLEDLPVKNDWEN